MAPGRTSLYLKAHAPAEPVYPAWRRSVLFHGLAGAEPVGGVGGVPARPARDAARPAARDPAGHRALAGAAVPRRERGAARPDLRLLRLSAAYLSAALRRAGRAGCGGARRRSDRQRGDSGGVGRRAWLGPWRV